jgi:YesN/AraC family two-component response regulator
MSYNILIIDDDRSFREELKDLLWEYSTTEAGSGQEAMDTLSRPNDIDLILLDVMLPGGRGTRLLSEIRCAAPGAAVIIMTGYSSKEIAIEALKGNADDYIEKPLNPGKLIGIIEEMLEKKGRKGPVELTDINSRIEKVKVFLERNWDKKVTLKDAAGKVFLSPKYLSRVFKKQTGESFNEFKLKVKLNRAGEMLKESGLTVQQIAYELGYMNIESFIRIFKKFNGLTPGQYREVNSPCHGKRK